MDIGIQMGIERLSVPYHPPEPLAVRIYAESLKTEQHLFWSRAPVHTSKFCGVDRKEKLGVCNPVPMLYLGPSCVL